MDFPAFSSICSSNKAECDVNAGCMRCECQSFFCSSCRFARGSCVAEKTKRGRDEETKGLRVKETKGQRDEGTKRRRDKETKRQRVKETKGQKDEKTKRRRDEERKGREDENRVTSYSPPIRVVSSSPPNSFNSYSIRVQKHLRDSCFKTVH